MGGTSNDVVVTKTLSEKTNAMATACFLPELLHRRCGIGSLRDRCFHACAATGACLASYDFSRHRGGGD